MNKLIKQKIPYKNPKQNIFKNEGFFWRRYPWVWAGQFAL